MDWLYGDQIDLGDEDDDVLDDCDDIKEREGLGDRASRTPKSWGAVVERRFRHLAAVDGWTVSKRGWPDFILRRGDEVCFVEVKSFSEQQLKVEQEEVATLLSDAGFNVYRWDPESGFCKIH